MADTKRYPQGSFCWVDLATSDAEAAKSFYRDVMGWNAVDTSSDAGPPYSMLSHDGSDVAGLRPIAPDQAQPPHWSAYVSVDDLDGIVEKAKSLGAELVMEPVDVMSHGRMCFLRDPTGAVLGLWQPGDYIGAQIDNQVGARSWCELQTRDTAAAADFYSALLGWSIRTRPDLMGGSYVLFDLDGREIGGMLQIQDDWGPVPPNWAVYFAVADCDGTLSAARGHGARVVMEPMEIPDVGRFAFLADPQGAVFAIIQLAESS
jgi:uncharacterized protein